MKESRREEGRLFQTFENQKIIIWPILSESPTGYKFYYNEGIKQGWEYEDEIQVRAEAEEISRYISEYQLCLNIQLLGSWVRHSPRKEYSHTQTMCNFYFLKALRYFSS